MERGRELIVKWLHKTINELTPGEEYLFPAETKADQKAKRKQFEEELAILEEIDPITASQMQVSTTFKDYRYWVVIKKRTFSPLVAFKKSKNGVITRMSITDDFDKNRRILLMKEDGYSLEKVEEIEGELTDEEKEIFGKEG